MRRLLPPGPKKRPIVGNLFDMPTRPWDACTDWSKEYDSDIIHLDMAGQSMVVLSSVEATQELLEKRSSMYSDRPPFPMVNDLMRWDFNLPFMRYGEQWRAHRRLFSEEFNMVAAQSFHQVERTAAHTLLRRLLADPAGFRGYLRQMTGEVIIGMTYGFEVQPKDDPYIALTESAIKYLAAARVPGKFFVDSIPLLKYIPEWFPGAAFQRFAKEGRVWSEKLREIPFEETKRRMAAGEASPCFTTKALHALEGEGRKTYYDETTVKNVAAAMYAAGADTTTTALYTFFLAMLANPEAQRKAQEEIDRVVGGLPDFETHKDELPYVAALIKEVLRWKSVLPLGVQHYTNEKDMYGGYLIPAGSLVIGNVWAILHDEKVYPDPHTFNPERFLGANPQPDPNAAFGFGRRICPGRHVATDSIWIAVVSVLAMFNITKEVSEDGEVVEPSYQYEGGAILAPLPFRCTITPRSAEAVRVVEGTGV
ncbi:cytochrome P450 [Roridomyces roridus]|uniref:Cytochrome P450 n=1 Tax=Roridomyces roridus TaxID=1738132 RepID=A0AAD7B4P4_9AGAR|nr:cytochrome P450 [Roridomyces roridus]